MKTFRTLLTTIALFAASTFTIAQSVGINTDGSSPNASAMLDVKSASKGLLIPNVELTGSTDASTITTPAVSLLVYNTATVSNVTPGYYYNSGSGSSPVWTRLVTTLADGSETKMTAGTNVTLSGSGTLANPYVINATISYGDIKQGIQSADHNGWIKLNGRLKSSLTATQQTQATALGLGTNLPDASNSFPVQNGTTLGSVSGSNTVTIAKNQLPDVTYSGTLYDVAHGAYVSATADGVFTRYGNGHMGNATGSGGTNNFTLNIDLNGGVTQQALNITPKSLSVNMFIYLGI
jgi:hypothetical protein